LAALRIKLYRFDPDRDEASRYQEYEIEADGSLSVLQAVRYIYRQVDGSLSFRNSDCRRGVCGVCSMMIDGRRRLSCMIVAKDGMTVGPPPNREVIKDLVFDMD